MSRARAALALLLFSFAAIVCADEPSFRILQSGSASGPTTVYDNGIRGEGQVIAVLDTGLDYDNCYFAEANGAEPPVNTVTSNGAFDVTHVDAARRKVVAYDFLYSCDQYPSASGCESPLDVTAFDNQGHGTHAAGAAAGDKGTFGVHDSADGVALASKLVIQDAGFIGGDNCTQRPGLLCPTIDMRLVLDQAYRQGARIHSDSWGDRQGVPNEQVPPTANYALSARQIDDYIWTHPEMVVVFNTGNAGQIGDYSISSPGDAKNTIQVGGIVWGNDPSVVYYSGIGPTRDGRIKPDLVAPVNVTAGDADMSVATGNCNAGLEGGTSFSSPTVAGAAALVRQYYAAGYYPTGTPAAANRFAPTAALVKATLIASARRAPLKQTNGRTGFSKPVPSNEQGWGYPVLGDALYFPGDVAKLRAVDRRNESGLAQGGTYTTTLRARSDAPLEIVLVWTDAPGHVAGTNDTTPQLVNDLDLVVTDPDGVVHYGNETLHPGAADRLNNVESLAFGSPQGFYRITVKANRVAVGPAQGFALVVRGDVMSTRSRLIRRR